MSNLAVTPAKFPPWTRGKTVSVASVTVLALAWPAGNFVLAPQAPLPVAPVTMTPVAAVTEPNVCAATITLPAGTPPLVQRTVQRLIRAFAPERIAFFGSYAKGTVHDRSDVDLLVIANVEGSPAFHQRRARQLAADCFPAVDIILATPADIAEAATARSPFLLSILGSGITVYTRPSP